jgi:hypothetical protein
MWEGSCGVGSVLWKKSRGSDLSCGTGEQKEAED